MNETYSNIHFSRTKVIKEEKIYIDGGNSRYMKPCDASCKISTSGFPWQHRVVPLWIIQDEHDDLDPLKDKICMPFHFYPLKLYFHSFSSSFIKNSYYIFFSLAIIKWQRIDIVKHAYSELPGPAKSSL